MAKPTTHELIMVKININEIFTAKLKMVKLTMSK
jgi:hypothetical protein